MTDKEFDKVLEMLALPKNKNIVEFCRSNDCLSEELMAKIIDDNYTQKEYDYFIKHIAECDLCVFKIRSVIKLVTQFDNTGDDNKVNSNVFIYTLRICPKCKALNTHKEDYCEKCKHLLTDETGLICYNCNSQIRINSKCCPSCGIDLLAKEHQTGDYKEIVKRWLPAEMSGHNWLVEYILTNLISLQISREFIEYCNFQKLKGGLWLPDKDKQDKFMEIYNLWKAGDKIKTNQLIDKFLEKVKIEQ